MRKEKACGLFLVLSIFSACCCPTGNSAVAVSISLFSVKGALSSANSASICSFEVAYPVRIATNASEIEIRNVLEDKTERIGFGESFCSNPALSGNRLAFQANSGGSPKIVLFDRTTTSLLVVSEAGESSYSPVMKGNHLCWTFTKKSEIGQGIRLFGLSDGKSIVLKNSDQSMIVSGPVINDLGVFWSQFFENGFAVFKYDFLTSTTQPLCKSSSVISGLSADGNILAYSKRPQNGFPVTGCIDGTGKVVVLDDVWSDKSDPSVSGTCVVWSVKKDGASEIKVWNGSTNILANVKSAQCTPCVSEGNVVWHDQSGDGGSDIYGAEISGGGVFRVTSGGGNKVLPRISGQVCIWLGGTDEGFDGAIITP